MASKTEKFYISSRGFDDVIDITSKVQDSILATNEKYGIVNIFTPSSTSSIVIIEDEPALTFDLAKLLERFVPINQIYQHDNIWHDGNANAHLKALILKNNLTLPLFDGAINIGQNQKILLIDFDNKLSTKEIVVTVVS